MSKPFDATSKDLLETDPAGWVRYLTRADPQGAVRVVDADVSTVTADADKVIRVDGPTPGLLHLEFQANADAWLVPRLLGYNTLLYNRHQVFVSTYVVLLRSFSGASALTGRWPISPPFGPRWEFKYTVIRIWECSPTDFLTGSLALIPLAPLTARDPAALPEIVNRMGDRIRVDADRPLAAKLWASTYVLLGLRYDTDIIDRLLEGVLQMEESTTYQALLARGEARGMTLGRLVEVRAILARQGSKRFGPLPPTVAAALEGITDLGHLEGLADRILDVHSWDELLSTP
ncbi:hypothetical protein [Fimbriiglobus ruber]|uniref:DUF4351 domain-containing protein n=1 Tax=Fimbriiglobus ruber TaxID=1908690 RepID=A0A225DDW3_9BACT|nr:hypothetical protein [Fimbriiglobus ruber]OWK39741.1 hypothetical protein FRUB_05631 [Fimbriiglobus ruber]